MGKGGEDGGGKRGGVGSPISVGLIGEREGEKKGKKEEEWIEREVWSKEEIRKGGI